MSLDDNTLMALGRISANFQALEARLAFYAWNLLGTSQDAGAIVTSQLSFQRLSNVVEALFHLRGGSSSVSKELSELMARIRKAESERNKYLHSSWGTVEEDGSLVRMKPTVKKSQLQLEMMPATTEELSGLADNLRECSSTLSELMARARKEGVFDYPHEGLE